MLFGETITVSIPAGAAQDAASNSSLPSTSTDNQVTYDRTTLPRQALSAGNAHTCWNVLGGIYCWGGQGEYDFGQVPPPTTIGPFDQVGAGYAHTCALKRDGTVQCWGDNTHGQLNQPGGIFTQINAGYHHTCGLRPDGSPVCWGAVSIDEDFGQATPPAGQEFVQISAGYHHSCGLDLYGSAVCWGDNAVGQSDPPQGGPFLQLSAGSLHTCALRMDGGISCWGLGGPGDMRVFAYGQADPPSGEFTQVSAGAFHTCGLGTDGSVACWGAGSPGTSGTVHMGQATLPFSVGTFQSVGAGVAHSCTVRSDYSLLCWGNNEAGQAPQFTLTPSSLTDGSVGFGYDQTITAAGVSYSPQPTIFYKIVAGALPPGLTLSNTGSISGIPTLAGSYDFTIRAVDAGEFSADQTYTIAIQQDADNIPDAVEDGAPNNGDGNNDGTPDSQQAHVASLPNAVDETYFTLEAPAGATLAEVQALPIPEGAPADLQYPSGMLSYEVQGLTPGEATTVTLYLPAGIEINSFYKYGPTPEEPTDHWYEFLFDGTTGAEITGNSTDGYVIMLHFVDGGRGDGDLTVNGEYSDPGAPAFDAGMSEACLFQSDGATPIEGAEVQYYSGGWQAFGTTGADGCVRSSIPPKNYKFRISYGGASIEKYQDLGADPLVAFQTVHATVELRDSAGALMDTGTAEYYAGGWQTIGDTSGGQVRLELLPRNYKFRLSYAGASIEFYQDIGIDPVVLFQTVLATVELRDSTGALMDTGTAEYYAGGWQAIGDTSGGQVSLELLPRNYKFRLSYAGASIEFYQDIGSDPLVAFQTVHATVELRDSAGALMDTGTAEYYAGGWQAIGDTSGGQVSLELLPRNYKFRLSYAGASNEFYQDLGANPLVTFRTGQVVSDSDTCTHYYAGGWREFTNGMEMLPKEYKFRFSDDSPEAYFSVVTGTVTHIH